VNRNRWILLGSIVAVLLIVVIWRVRTHQAPQTYRTARVDRGSIEQRVSATGTIRPVIQVQVGSQVSGTVSKIFADYNSRVKKGQVLLQIDPSAFKARVLQNQAAVDRAVAGVRDGQRQLDRAQALIKEQIIAQTELEAAQVTLQQRNADLKQARAQLDASQVDLANTTIRAPIDGVVISRSIDVGQTVAASLQAPQLFVLGNDLTRMQVETNIDEADIGQVRSGLPVTFTVDAFQDATFNGTVSQVRLDPITQQGVVTYTTVIGAPNPDLRLRPGMTANVSVLIDRRDDVLRVPAAALRFRPPGAGTGGRRGAGAAGGSVAAARGDPSGGGTGDAGGAQGAAYAQGENVAASSGAADTARFGRYRSGHGGRGGAPDSARMRRWAMRGGAAGAGGGRVGGGGGLRRGASADSSARSLDVSGSEIPTGPMYKPGAVYVLRGKKPVRVRVLSGLSDGTNVEVQSDSLAVGDLVIIGLEVAATGPSNLQPPPGMGGPQFRGPRGGAGGGGRGR
jgi:HlyD family secretion protein